MTENTQFLDFLSRYYREDQIEMPEDYLTCMAPMQGTIGSVQARKLRDMVGERRRLAAVYHRALAEAQEIERPPLAEEASYSHYTVQVAHRGAFVRHMERAAINVGTLFDYAVPALSAYQPFCPGETFPHAEELATRVVNLPNYPGLSTEQVNRICHAASQFQPHW